MTHRFDERRGRLAAAVAGCGVVVAVVALLGRGASAAGPVERLLFTIVPLALVVVVVVAAADRSIAVGGALVAVAPSVVAAIAGGEAHALLAAVAIAAAVVGSDPRFGRVDAGVRVLATATTFVALLGAWAFTVPVRTGSSPDGTTTLSTTGVRLRTMIVGDGAIGVSGTSVALLAWFVAVGLLVGVALLSARPMSAAIVPAALAFTVLASWLVERWRGPVEGGSGLWIVAAALVVTAWSQRDAPGITDAGGRAVWMAAGVVLGLGVATHVRAADGSDARLVLGVVAAAVVAGAAWLPSRIDARQGEVAAGSGRTTAGSVTTMHSDEQTRDDGGRA